jgi:hypothetical protein
MNTSSSSFSVRKNFIILLLLTISGIVVTCWLLLMLLVIMTGGPIFQDKSQLSLDIFMVFLFPFFLAIMTSVFSLLFTAIARQKWWISVPLSILLLGLPLAAYVFTWFASWVARLFYIVTPEDEERTKKFLSMSIGSKTEKPVSEIEQIKKMKLLLDEGIITQDEFNLQKQKVLSDINSKLTIQSAPRYFSIWQTTVAAALGGFLAGAVLIAINFKRLDKKEQFKSSLFVGIIGFMIAVTISVSTTMILTSLPDWLIVPVTIVYPILIYLWHNEAMKDTVSILVKTKQAKNESWWLVLGVSLVTLVLNYLVAIPVLIIIAYFQPTTIN